MWKTIKWRLKTKKDYLPKTTEKGTACIIDNRKSWIQKTTKTNSFMIEKIMSKLGMVVLWCIVIIYGIGVITHICSDIIGVVVRHPAARRAPLPPTIRNGTMSD